MFEHGIEQVEVDDPNVEVLEEGSHGSHLKENQNGSNSKQSQINASPRRGEC